MGTPGDPFYVDPEDIARVARGAAARADHMVTLVRDMNKDIDFVRFKWEGGTGDAFRNTLDRADLQMEGLTTKLLLVSDELKQIADAFASQEDSSRTTMVATQVPDNPTIPGTINFA